MTTTCDAKYRVEHDATNDLYTWVVLDSEGDVVDEYATKAEAVAEASERNIEAEREELIAAIDLDGLSLKTLRKIKALIG